MIVREVGPNGEYGPVPDLSPIEGFPLFFPHEITGTWLHDFYQKFGFPYELTLEVIQQRPGRKKLLPFQIDKIKKNLKKNQNVTKKYPERELKQNSADTGYFWTPAN